MVDGILTGVHGPGESHFALLQAFAARRLLEAASTFADAAGFRSHEFGDAMLVMPPVRPRRGGQRRAAPDAEAVPAVYPTPHGPPRIRASRRPRQSWASTVAT